MRTFFGVFIGVLVVTISYFGLVSSVSAQSYSNMVFCHQKGAELTCFTSAGVKIPGEHVTPQLLAGSTSYFISSVCLDSDGNYDRDLPSCPSLGLTGIESSGSTPISSNSDLSLSDYPSDITEKTDNIGKHLLRGGLLLDYCSNGGVQKGLADAFKSGVGALTNAFTCNRGGGPASSFDQETTGTTIDPGDCGANFIGSAIDSLNDYFKDGAGRVIAEKLAGSVPVVGSFLEGFVGGLLGGGGDSGPQIVRDEDINKKELCYDALAQVAARKVLQKFSDKTLNWIRTGLNGNPLFVQDYLAYQLSRVGSEARDWLTSTDTFQDVCQAFRSDVALMLQDHYYRTFTDVRSPDDYIGGVPVIYRGAFERALTTNTANKCGLERAIEENEGELEFFLAGEFVRGGWDAWDALSNDNPYKAVVNKTFTLNRRIEDVRQEARFTADAGGGFLPDTRCTAPAEEETVYRVTEGPQEGEVFFYSSDVPAGVAHEARLFWVDKTNPNEPRPIKVRLPGEQPPCVGRTIVTPGRLVSAMVEQLVVGDVRQNQLADEMNEVLSGIERTLFGTTINEGLIGARSTGDQSDPEARRRALENRIRSYLEWIGRYIKGAEEIESADGDKSSDRLSSTMEWAYLLDDSLFNQNPRRDPEVDPSENVYSFNTNTVIQRAARGQCEAGVSNSQIAQINNLVNALSGNLRVPQVLAAQTFLQGSNGTPGLLQEVVAMRGTDFTLSDIEAKENELEEALESSLYKFPDSAEVLALQDRFVAMGNALIQLREWCGSGLRETRFFYFEPNPDYDPSVPVQAEMIGTLIWGMVNQGDASDNARYCKIFPTSLGASAVFGTGNGVAGSGGRLDLNLADATAPSNALACNQLSGECRVLLRCYGNNGDLTHETPPVTFQFSEGNDSRTDDTPPPSTVNNNYQLIVPGNVQTTITAGEPFQDFVYRLVNNVGNAQLTFLSGTTTKTSTTGNHRVIVNRGTFDQALQNGTPGTYTITYKYEQYVGTVGGVDGAQQSGWVTVPPQISRTIVIEPATTTVTLSSNNASVNSGSTVTLTWSVIGTVQRCSASGAWSGTKSRLGGSQELTVVGTQNEIKTYTLSCDLSNGSQITDSVNVIVNVSTTSGRSPQVQ